MDTELNRYLHQLVQPSNEWSRLIEQEALNNHIPIMDQVSMQFVCQMIQLIQPKHILEIGTAIGYSALRMHEAYPHATITTIEQDEQRYNRAKELIAAQGKTDHIHLMYGSAQEVLTSLQTTGHTFDMAFIDAAKGQYQAFFEKIDPMMRAGGTVLSDNVLFRNLVASDEEIDRKYRSLVKKLRTYNEWLMNHDFYESTIIPIGDGIALSIKNKE